jgi:hypothetical protein
MSRGLKRSHHGPSTGNGNINLIELNPDSNPDTYVQHRERARSPGSQLPSPTTANPNGQANQNSVLQTTNQTLAQSEFARLHQQMIQERRQQQQLAREEAAKLKERVKTALAKAIGWAIAASSRPDLDQADPLPVPTTGGPPGGGSLAPVSTKPGSAAAQQQPGEGSLVVPQQPGEGSLVVPQQPGEGSPVVPQHQPGGSPAPVSAKPGLAAAQHQPGEGNLAASTPKSRKLIQKSTKYFQERPKYLRQKIGKFRQILMSKNVIRMVLGRSRKKFSHKNKISNKNPKKRKEKSHHLSRMEKALGRSRKKFSHKNKISNKILKKLLKYDNPNKKDALVVSADH